MPPLRPIPQNRGAFQHLVYSVFRDAPDILLGGANVQGRDVGSVRKPMTQNVEQGLGFPHLRPAHNDDRVMVIIRKGSINIPPEGYPASPPRPRLRGVRGQYPVCVGPLARVSLRGRVQDLRHQQARLRKMPPLLTQTF